MKRSTIAIIALCVLLGAQMMLTLDVFTAKAGVWCTDLANCTGNAGCRNNGSVSECTITCSDGSQVQCNKKDMEIE